MQIDLKESITASKNGKKHNWRRFRPPVGAISTPLRYVSGELISARFYARAAFFVQPRHCPGKPIKGAHPKEHAECSLRTTMVQMV